MTGFDYDVLIIGSGFGGSVAALRAAERATGSASWKTRRNTMTELAADAFRTVGPGDAIPDGFVVPFYLSDRKLRIAVARAGNHLHAFDDLCTCAGHAAAAWGGESDG